MSMDWMRWKTKHVFLRTKHGKVFSGEVEEVADMGDGLIFISIIDKFDALVMLRVDEIVEIKEEEKRNGSRRS